MKVRSLILIFAFLLLLVIPARAQVPFARTVVLHTAAGNEVGAIADSTGLAIASIQVTGTFNGAIVTFQTSTDRTNYNSVSAFPIGGGGGQLTTTSAGQWWIPLNGAKRLKAPITGGGMTTSLTVTVNMVAVGAGPATVAGLPAVGPTTASGGLPVAFPTDQNDVTPRKGMVQIGPIRLTRANNNVTYAAGQFVGDVSLQYLTIPGAARVAGGTGFIDKMIVVLTTSAVNTTNLTFDTFFFDTAPAQAQVDNTTFVASTDEQHLIEILTGSGPQSSIGTTVSLFRLGGGNTLGAFKCAGGSTSLYFQNKALTAWAGTLNSATIDFTFQIEQN